MGIFKRKVSKPGQVVGPLLTRAPRPDVDRITHESYAWQALGADVVRDDERIIATDMAMVFPDLNKRRAKGWIGVTDVAVACTASLDGHTWGSWRIEYPQIKWFGPSRFGDGSLQLAYVDDENPEGAALFFHPSSIAGADLYETLVARLHDFHSSPGE